MPYMLSCDSTTDLTLAQYAALDLHYVSLHFLLDGKEYPDDYGQSLPMKTFFDAMAAGATTGTSQVTTGEFELYFRQFLEQGSDILHVSLSSGLSGCYHSACAARDMLLEEFPERKIIVVDSLCGSGGAAILMLEAARQRDAGRTMEETAAWIEARRLHVHHWLFTPELAYFYPTSTLVTGYDIIFFWVARMIFSGVEHMGEAPFDTVLIHGLIRDAQGRKMSKSLGNGVDPLEVIAQYGADALRFMLATGNSPGNDMRFTTEKVESSRNFANKLWNAARFILMNLGDGDIEPGLPDTLTLEDKWILSKFNSLARAVTDNLEKFELGLAVQKLYDFIWDQFCDWYIELCKARLQGEKAADARRVLVFVMTRTLSLLHPFMPFVTEEIWQSLPHEGEALMVSAWPEYDDALSFPAEEKEMERIMAAIRAIRNRRAEMNVPPSRKAQVYVETAFAATFTDGAPFIERLASASEVIVGERFELDGAVSIVTADATIKIPMDELVDKEAERARLTKEKETVQKQLDGVLARLSNEAFTSKAPANVVETARENAARLKEKLALLEQSLAALA